MGCPGEQDPADDSFLSDIGHSIKNMFSRGDVTGGVNRFTDAPGTGNCLDVDPLAYNRIERERSDAERAIEELIDPPPEAPPLRRNTDGRRLLEFPTSIESAHVGACQSRHYSPDGGRVDQYIAPHTGCAFASVLQDWNEICPGTDSGCRLAWGDISHKTQVEFNGHKSHTGGECIDMRPIRKQGGGPLTYRHQMYDQEKTQQLINLLREKGGTAVLFNDPGISGATEWAGHDNHIHVCFRNDTKVRDTCEDYEPDYNRCPMLYNFLESDEVKRVREN